MLIFWAVLGGFVLDAIFADPAWLPHPVVLMGRCISALEKRLRAALPTTPQGELLGGGIVAAVLPLGTLLVTGAACWLAAKLHPALGLALPNVLVRAGLAAKGLKQESMNVYKELQKGDLPAAARRWPHRGTRYPKPDCRRRDQSGGGDCGPRTPATASLLRCSTC